MTGGAGRQPQEAGARQPFAGFPKDTVTFLRALARNNREEWMAGQRERYEAVILEPARRAVVAIGDALHAAGCQVVADPRVNGSIFRIARDRRFRPDAPPYKSHLALLWWAEGVRMEEPAFYIQVNTKGIEYGVGLPEIPRGVLPRFRRWLAEDDHAARLLATMDVPATPPVEWEIRQLARPPLEFRGLEGERARAVRLVGGWGGWTRVPHPPEVFTADCAAWLVAQYQPLLPFWRVLREGLAAAGR